MSDRNPRRAVSDDGSRGRHSRHSSLQPEERRGNGDRDLFRRPTDPRTDTPAAARPQPAHAFGAPAHARAPEPAHASHANDEWFRPSHAEAEPSAEQRGLGRSIVMTLLSTLVPGLGLLGARSRGFKLLGLATSLAAFASLGYLAYRGLNDQSGLVKLASNEHVLALATPAIAVAGLAWVVLILVTHLATRPPQLRAGRRIVSAVTVAALAFAAAAPTAVAARYTRDAFLLVDSVLPDPDDVLSSTRPSLDANDPWADIPRVNILLLGADGDAGRKEQVEKFGVRTDTIMVASIDTTTGDTVLIQIPRNLQHTPFPEGSELAKQFPRGFRGEPAEDWFINSVWPKVELEYPDLMKGNTYRGAEALKLGVEGVTGLKMDYFLMLNIDGLQQLIDAMGGVTVNVNQRLPIGGSTKNRRATGGWIEAGANQHLDGYRGLWFARSRWSTDDYDRMRRQSCLVNAIVDQANPTTLLTRFEPIAAAGADMLKTDITSQDASAIVDLAFRVKDASVTRLVFSPGKNGYSYESPDFEAMRAAVQEAIDPSEPQPQEPTAAATPQSPPSTASAPPSSPSASSEEDAGRGPSGEPGDETSPSQAEEHGAHSVSDACAYSGP